jgi:hypothetical protein
MCSKESGIDSNRTFIGTCPYARSIPRRRGVTLTTKQTA